MEAIVPLVVAAIVLGIPLIWLVVNYNRFVRLRQHIHESWSDIDVELKRRYDLIPNLVATVQGVARHERNILEEVIRLRNRAMANQGTAAEHAIDESALQIGLGRLFAIVEGYPELRSDSHFLALQQELSNTEDRIAAARRFFNANVRELNQLCQTFPTNVLASLFGFEQASYFELESEAERVVPRMPGRQSDEVLVRGRQC